MQANVANRENVPLVTDQFGSASSQPQQVFHGFRSGRGGCGGRSDGHGA